MIPKQLDEEFREYQRQIDILKDSGFTKVSKAADKLQELLNRYIELAEGTWK